MFRIKKTLAAIILCTLFTLAHPAEKSGSSVNLALGAGLFDPVGMLKSFAEELLPTTNIYEHRQKYLATIKEFFEDEFQKRKSASLKEITEQQQFLTEKKQSIRPIDGPEEDVLAKIADIQALLSDTTYAWDSYTTIFEDHLAFLEKNFEDLFNETVFKKRKEGVEVRTKFSSDEISKLEEELARVQQEEESSKQKKSLAERQKTEDESSLEAFKKEATENKKRETAKHFTDRDDSALSDALSTMFSQKKMYQLKLQVEKATWNTSFVNKEIELLKSKAKSLEQLIKKMRPRLFATSTDLEERRNTLQAEEQKFFTEKEKIDRELETKKQQRDTLLSEANKLKSKLKTHKDAFEKSSGSSQERDSTIESFILESKITKLRYDAEVVRCRMERLETKKKQEQMARDEAFYQYLRVQTIFLASNSDNYEKEFMEVVKKIEESVSSEIAKQQESVVTGTIDDYLHFATTTKQEELKARHDSLLAQKNASFIGRKSAYQEAMDLSMKSKEALDEQIKIYSEMRLIGIKLDKQKKNLLGKLEALKKEVAELDGIPNRWKRHPNAITRENVNEAVRDGEYFFRKWFWDSKEKLNPLVFVPRIFNASGDSYSGFAIILLIFLICGFVCFRLLERLKNIIDQAVAEQSSRAENRYALLLLIGVNLIVENFYLIFTWFFIHILARNSISVLGFSLKNIGEYYISLFYLSSIPFLISLSARFLDLFKSFNQQMNYFFFSERTTIKNMFLLSGLLYSSVLILPFWFAVSSYSLYFKASAMKPVLLAAYTLLVGVVFALFLDREDVLSLVPKYGYLTWLFHSTVDRFYYPVLMFFVCIYIIFNPYVGYANLGLYLLFVVPMSTAIIFSGYLAQSYNRHHAQWIFLKESDVEGEIVETFEHGKMFYGVYIVSSFFLIWIAVYAALAHLWTGSTHLNVLWKHVSEVWTVQIGEKGQLGLVQVFSFLLIIFSGYFAASFFERTILRRLFDAFRVDTGLENTMSKIFQYAAIIFSIFVGMAMLNLTDLVKYVLAIIAFGIGLGMKDQIADIFAGILILLERQIEEGHFVDFHVGSTYYRGTVRKISVRSTTICTVRNLFITVPNKSLISGPITNWGAGRIAVGMEFQVNVAYGADPDMVSGIIKQIIYDNPLVLKVPAALVRLDDFVDYGMVFFARSFVNARRVREQWDIAANIRTEIIKAFKEHKIKLAYPYAVVNLTGGTNPSEHSPISIKLDGEEEKGKNLK